MENESQHNQLYDQIFKDYCAGYTNPNDTHDKTLNQQQSCVKKTLSEMVEFVNSSNKYNTIAGRLREGIVLIDLDEAEAIPHFDKLVKQLKLTPLTIKTSRGKHYYFRVDNTQKINMTSGRINLYGVPCDKKTGNNGKNGCGIIYQLGEFREILSTPKELSFAPFELTAELYDAHAKESPKPYYELAEGNRNELFFKVYKRLYKRTGIDKKQAIDCVMTAQSAGILAGSYMERTEIESAFRDYDELPQFTGKAGRPSKYPHPADMADEMIEEHNIIRLDGYSVKLNLYHYCDNYYKQFEHEDELLGLIQKKYKYTSPAQKTAIKDNIKINLDIGKQRNNNLIAFNNGVIDTEADELQLLPHSPDYIVTYKIPFDFKPELQQFSKDEIKPLINALDLWTDHDKDLERQLYNIFGYCLTSNCRLEKFFVFTGIGSNGKSSFMNFAEYIIPKSMRGSLSPSQIANQFSPATLTNKLANFCHDTNLREWTNDMTDRIKVISSGESLHVDEKFVAPHDIKLFAKLIFNMNRLPRSKDTSRGFTRRIIVVPFEHCFEQSEKDDNLLQKLCTPTIASYFLSRAVITYKEELHNPNNPDHFFECKASKDAKDKWLQESNSVIAWNKQFDYDWKQPKFDNKTLYNFYTDFCDSEQLLGKFSKKEFINILISQFGLVNEQKRINGENAGKVLFKR